MDKIQGEYGWTDDQVLNLTVRRAVQINESISQRLELRKWEDLKITEWQTRQLATMIANTVEDNKARKELVSQAQDLSLTQSPNKKRRFNRPKTYKTIDGKTIKASELKNYRYDEIDHSEEDAMLIEAARRKNAGINIKGVMGSMTR